MEVIDVLKKPYARQVVPQPDGVFKAEILEFPGCFAVGDTAVEALASLEEVAAEWITVAIAQGQDIPEPTESAGYSGKLGLRMSKSLHKKAAQFALRDGVSLNQFLVNCISEHVGMFARPTLHYWQPARAEDNFTLQLGGAWRLLANPAGAGGLLQAATQTRGRIHVPLESMQDEEYA